ncbi:TonB-dependent receptor [Hyphobacterium sp. CCMP332]|uniref:TonB-dependent receptor n=1 Tax=Hyphobacterium sp. CCMP332 TaxID=2749086 RepID=UPI00164F73C0|nr:TonB-dependent receptor [Hyphobacterium sp. CCMP332]QNL18466.1 TonB-dependent receptor [Hyphobacterium sp. CCMP332]
MKMISRAALMAAVSAAAFTAPAFAQERQTVDVITVTAQKREQGIQDVPVAVTAYTAELLQNAGIRDIRDLAVIAPGLNITSTSSEYSTTARIRGVGTVGDNPGLESSVGIVIDGVPRARNGVSFGDLGEIERIEVLRGPQGTLFGANTSAGIINIVTAGPEFEFGANAEATYLTGGADGFRISGSVTGPIAEDQAAFRIYAARGERDGFQSVQTFGGPRTINEDNNQDFYTIRGQLLFNIGDRGELTLQGDFTSRDENCCGAPSIVSGPTAAAVNALQPGGRPLPGSEDPFSRVIQSNRDTTQDIEDGGFQFQYEYEFENFSLTAIGSTRDYEIVTGQDTDFTGADIVYRDPSLNSFEFGNSTFELRAQGQRENLDWMVGAFFSTEDLVRRDAIQYGSDFEAYLGLIGGGDPVLVTTLANGLGGAFIPGYTPLAPGQGFPAGSANSGGDRYEQDGQTFGIFTHNTFALTENTDLTFGLRWNSTEKDATAQFSPGNAPACDVWETVFGEALDFSTAQNQAILAGFSQASQVSVAGLIQFGTFTCLPSARDVYSNINFNESLSEDEFTGLVSLSHRFNEDFLMYGTYSRGYKAGGFNLDRFTQAGSNAVNFTNVLAGTSPYPAQFDPEIVNSFEIGFKTEGFNDTLLANLYLFHSDFESFQLNTFNGLAFFVTSLNQGAVTQGAELELLWFPEEVQGLTIQGGITYADATYNSFAPTGTPDVDRLSGQNFSLAPEWYTSASISYVRPFGDGMEWLAHLSGRYMSEQNTGSDLDPEKIQEGYSVFNARVGIGADDQSWALELFANNLFDEDYIQVGFDGPFQPGSFNAFLGQPRMWGVTLRARR